MTSTQLRAVLIVTALLLVAALPAGAQSAARKVLILNSFEREFSPYSDYAKMVRGELNRRSPVPISFFEVSLQLALTPEQANEQQTVQYLQAILSGQRLDLIVTIGGNAAGFVQRHRANLFPSTPVLAAALNERRVPALGAGDNTTAVATSDDFPQMIQNILDVRPDTSRIFVVIGTSPFEQYWIPQIRRELERFERRVAFEWSNKLSHDEILHRVSSLPPHSAIFYVTLLVDARGAVQTDERVLAELRAAANAPLFGQYDIQIGQGIVGGSMTRIVESSGTCVDVALRILDGERPAAIKVTIVDKGPPTYDWRELRRWGIREAQLPAGSIVKFRPPSAWDEYRSYIIGAGVLVVGQTALIAGLFVQRSRRRRTEVALRQAYEQNQDLAGRLIGTQEAERTRIARDLHDDVSQQLASVGIVLSSLKRAIAQPASGADVADAVKRLQERNSALVKTVRSISHELHPSVLKHAGLRSTLQRHCSEIAEHHQLAVAFDADDSVDALHPDVALCLFRVAQETLANAVRHAQARTIQVQLLAGRETVELTIVDDGIGFVTGERTRSGLGLRSMEERARLVGGSIRLESRPAQGTRIVVRVPFTRAENPAVETEPTTA